MTKRTSACSTCLRELPEPGAADAISLMLELAVDALFRSDAEPLLEWTRRARAAAETLGDRPLIASTGAIRALGYAVGGHIAQAEAAYAETAALVAAMPDAELGDRSDALAYLCSVGTFLDRYDEACAHGERALRLGRSAGHLHPTLLPALGAAHLLRGRLATRRTCSTPAWRRHGSPGSRRARPGCCATVRCWPWRSATRAARSPWPRRR